GIVEPRLHIRDHGRRRAPFVRTRSFYLDRRTRLRLEVAARGLPRERIEEGVDPRRVPARRSGPAPLLIVGVRTAFAPRAQHAMQGRGMCTDHLARYVEPQHD